MIFRQIISKIVGYCLPQLRPILNDEVSLNYYKNSTKNFNQDDFSKIYKPYKIVNCTIGKGTYISVNSRITGLTLGKFCSIGPNFVCGWGIHPIDGISTNPYFYSTSKQNGETLASKNLINERSKITIGNDVFIGSNVTVLDGITIGDGAVIGAGAVVSKNIPDYAVAYGNPIEIKKYRFNQSQIESLKRIAWWDFDDDKLKDINKMFFNIDEFIAKYDK